MPALGGRVRDARLERVMSSAQFDGARFVNAIDTPQTPQDLGGVLKEYVAGGQEREPREAIPVFTPETGSLVPAGAEPLRITWLDCDHLDYPTVVKLAGRETRWVTALGVGAHLEAWGVPAGRITELDWWTSTWGRTTPPVCTSWCAGAP